MSRDAIKYLKAIWLGLQLSMIKLKMQNWSLKCKTEGWWVVTLKSRPGLQWEPENSGIGRRLSDSIYDLKKCNKHQKQQL